MNRVDRMLGARNSYRIGVSDIVRIVNNEPQPKYSLEVLPGDSWETRRAKQVIRAVVRAKSDLNMTTEELARKCSAFLADPESIKTSTLNGLFAGKRKSISIAELEMFASVLMLSVMDLMYPTNELVEVKPGEFQKSTNALWDRTHPLLFPGNDFRVGGRTQAVFTVARRSSWLEEATLRALYSIRVIGNADMKIRDVQWHLAQFQTEYFTLEALDPQGMDLPLTSSWAMEVFEEKQITEDFILSLESRFRGFTVGEYRPGHEHPEAS